MSFKENDIVRISDPVKHTKRICKVVEARPMEMFNNQLGYRVVDLIDSFRVGCTLASSFDRHAELIGVAK